MKRIVTLNTRNLEESKLHGGNSNIKYKKFRRK